MQAEPESDRTLDQPTFIPGSYPLGAAPEKEGTPNSYRGLRMRALPGLHEHVAGLVKKHGCKGGAAIDLGAGSGAFSARLADMGYETTSVDYVEENFRAGAFARFARADLNGFFASDISAGAKVVMGMEIIEHLENPRNFLREATKLCAPEDGRIFLTTPNTDNPVSKAYFCRFGHHMWFSDKEYLDQGHITPLTQWQIRKSAEEIGLRIVHQGTFGDPFERVRRWPKMRLLAHVIRRLSQTDPALEGEIYVAVLARK